jgi:hypothetical protein
MASPAGFCRQGEQLMRTSCLNYFYNYFGLTSRFKPRPLSSEGFVTFRDIEPFLSRPESVDSAAAT